VVLPQLVILERALAQVDAASGGRSGGVAVSPAERDAAARRAAASSTSTSSQSSAAAAGSSDAPSAGAADSRIVCLRRNVFASRALPDGTTQELPLGAAAFDDSKGKPQLVRPVSCCLASVYMDASAH
jgi:hypothetical protein